jgi:predicted adenylyl cyclase CyaB
MGRNIEIKARASDPEGQIEKASRISDSPPEVIEQEDTFFPCRSGRLKLRTFVDGTGELIHYERADTAGPKESCYLIGSVPEAARLNGILRAALGQLGVVRKKRTLFRVGQTRIHFDQVEGLGVFIELEVVLDSEQTGSKGRSIAEHLMGILGIAERDLVNRAYVDLLADRFDSRHA